MKQELYSRRTQQADAWVWLSSSSCVPPVGTQVVRIVPPGHPCLSTGPSAVDILCLYLSHISFPFSFFHVFLRFSFSLLPFSVFPLLFVSSFSVAFCFAFFAFLFASLLSLVAHSVLLSTHLSRCYTPPALLASLQICVFPLCAVLLAFLL